MPEITLKRVLQAANKQPLYLTGSNGKIFPKINALEAIDAVLDRVDPQRITLKDGHVADRIFDQMEKIQEEFNKLSQDEEMTLELTEEDYIWLFNIFKVYSKWVFKLNCVRVIKQFFGEDIEIE